MRFEFDAAKSAVNKAKHGIDFVEAQALWNDAERVEGPGRWTATVTYRHENTIRLVSVRRARDSAQAQYVDARERRR